MIFNMTGGGKKEDLLNFDVKDFRTETELLSSSGVENRIGVVTTIPMTDWRFDANQPDDLQEGEIWIFVGTESAVAFDALKKNGIQIYPISAKQKISGVLVDVVAKSYHNGAWKDWVEYVIQNGVVKKYGFSTQLRSQTTLPVTVNDGYITVKGNSSMNSGVLTDEKISMEKVSEVLIDVDIIQLSANTGTAPPFDGVSLVLGQKAMCSSLVDAEGSILTFVNTTKTGRQTLSLPVKDVYSPCYIGIVFGEAAGAPVPTVNIYNLSLKP